MLGGSRLAILGWREGKAQGGNPPTELAVLTARGGGCTFPLGKPAAVSLPCLLRKDVRPHRHDLAVTSFRESPRLRLRENSTFDDHSFTGGLSSTRNTCHTPIELPFPPELQFSQ